ncbi:MAG: hypothetical protein OXI80_09825 [Caldilineaceae bacterium]|nr:hypothetical protein [Caldilineaceae bacterium]MDE0337955.1 hypothetical protein [Caldilineaceae bacterium]
MPVDNPSPLSAKKRRLIFSLIISLALLSACFGPDLPGAPQMPRLPSPRSLPGVDELLDQLPGFDLDLPRELDLPDLSDIADLPQLVDLPSLEVSDNAIAFTGPTEMRIEIGDFIRGTDIQLAGIVDGRAEFLFSGLRAERIAGDSLDFDGPWPNIGGVDYLLRLRVYRVTEEYVRAAGVHRLVIEGILPIHQPAMALQENVLKMTYTGSVGTGDQLKGTTFGYVGKAEQGAEISGIPAGDFPFRKSGDSLRWQGMLRPDLPSRFDLRIVHFGENSVQVAGIVSLQLPD